MQVGILIMFTLQNEAIDAKEKAYCPYSHLRVGAALLCGDGTIYTGANIENASFSLTICAERVAFIKAIMDGKKTFKTLTIASDSEDFPYPCGACLQFISEFVQDLEIILVNKFGEIKKETLKGLFPNPFRV